MHMVTNQGTYFTKQCQDIEENAAALTCTVPDSPKENPIAALHVLLPSAKVSKYLMVRHHWPVGQPCPFSYIFIHSLRSLCYDVQSEFSTECDLVHPLSISSSFSFP